jgi:23S rRNA (uracil1939-C5)-methyltransferase
MPARPPRAVLHAKRGGRKILAVGFTGRRSYVVVPIDQCPILAPPLARAIAIAWRLAEPLKPTGKPIDLAFTITDGGLDVDLRGTGPLNPKLTAGRLRRSAPRKNSRALPATASWWRNSRSPRSRSAAHG